MKILISYGMVGLASLVSYLFLFFLLVEWFEVQPVLACVLSYPASVALSYLGQFHFVFKSPHTHSTSLPRFLVLTIIGFLIILLSEKLFTGFFGLWYGFGQMIACILVPCSNFFFGKYWAFGITKSS